MRLLLLLPILLVAGTGPASAHIVSSRLGDFYGGALHPLTGLADGVLWLALGLLAGLQPARSARWITAAFPLGLLAGFFGGLAMGWTSDPLRLDAALMLALGLLTAAAWRLPGALLMALVVGLAVYRGAANASGLEAGTDTTLFALGVATAGYVALTLITAGVEAFRQNGAGWRSIAVRAGGSWIAAVGVMVGGFTFVA